MSPSRGVRYLLELEALVVFEFGLHFKIPPEGPLPPSGVALWNDENNPEDQPPRVGPPMGRKSVDPLSNQ